ncbi:hypothetical protein V9L05_08635 [Bernardetia sp. Wsw4-3y2]|uniref:hypothetical protein n=1 Tax=Bernardetia sp. Wsw4-3y2 TaxID=3127471 RepID=UPI0030D1FE93
MEDLSEFYDIFKVKKPKKYESTGVGSVDNSLNTSSISKEKKNEAKREQYAQKRDKRVESQISECGAYYRLISRIKVDEKRFQNRENAFSELSAQQVAENFNKNYFDPIVIWEDPTDKEYYVLSGHSRYEGLIRRGELKILCREFVGTESEAINYSRVIANRANNKESLVEDLEAFRIARDGNENIKPSSKKDLQQSFDDINKLDAYTYLNPKGMFIDALKLDAEGNENFKKIKTFSLWVGELRKVYDQITNTHEVDIFNFLYGDDERFKIKKDDFIKLVQERLAKGQDRLFPECSLEGCEPIKDYEFLPARQRNITRDLIDLQSELDELNERRASKNWVRRIYTTEEGLRLEEEAKKKKEQLKAKQRELRAAEKDEKEGVKFGLFGVHKNQKRKKRR